MNKETRNFIWGLILFMICGTATAMHIVDLIKGTQTTLTFILMPFTLIGAISGFITIEKSLK